MNKHITSKLLTQKSNKQGKGVIKAYALRGTIEDIHKKPL
jgi:hypothetical protein